MGRWRVMNEPAKIIIVDNDKNLLDSLSWVLANEGFVVDIAETGKQAIEKIKTDSYNLFLFGLDNSNGEMVELVSKIKDIAPNMLKLAMIDTSYFNNVNDLSGLGIDDYVIKPIFVTDVIGKIKGHLNNKRL